MYMTVTRLALIIRVLIALCTRTFFQPDEYFQSLEPAHHTVFGYAHLTWEWLASQPIRSIFYAALNMPIFWLLKVSGLAETPVLGDWFLIYCPRVLHGVLAAATDIWLCQITRRWLGAQYTSIALFLSLTSFFHALSLSRSISNSLETSLTTIAFAYYPWDVGSNLSSKLIYNKHHMKNTLIFSALACMVRPTNAIIWLYLYGKLLWALKPHIEAVKSFLFQGISVGSVALISLLALDTLYYQRPTFTSLNFLLTNLSSVSLFYGFNPWHYYLTQAIPVLCTTALPFVLHGSYLAVIDQHSTALRNMLSTVVWSVGIYSFAGHKEWRFIHPILPLLHIFAAKSLVDLSENRTVTIRKSKNTKPVTLNGFLPPIRRDFLIFLSLTIPASLYVILFYCSAPITVLSYIRTLPADELRNGGIGFLMPCHSTPGHAYIHRNYLAHGKMWSLGCEPPLQNQSLATYQDQTGIFFASPLDYLETRFPARVDASFPSSPFPASVPGAPALDGYPWTHEWPKYLVFFGALLDEEGVRVLFETKGYEEIWKRGRDWEGEGQRRGGVRVWKWKR